MRGLVSALGVLTRAPVGASGPADRTAVGWFALVGGVLGVSAAGPVWLAMRAGWDGGGAAAAAVLVVAWWAWATRMLHWDGLADTADGAWGAHEPAERLAVMADSSIGAFGATAVALTVTAQVAGIASAVQDGRVWPLVLAPVLGRTSAALLVWGSAPARRQGLGASLAGRPPVGGVIATAVTVTAAAAAVTLEEPSAAATAAFVGLTPAIALPFLIVRPFRGYTGDVLGATVLLVETAVLLLGGLM